MSRAPQRRRRDDPDLASFEPNEWIVRINAWSNTEHMRKWRESCKKIRDLYRYEDSVGAQRRRYALLWSNTQLMRGVTYARPPKADVSRRWRDNDPVARTTALMIERCVNFELDYEGYDAIFKQVRDDFLLEARGVARVVYEPVMQTVETLDDELDTADVRGPDAARAQAGADSAAAGFDEPDQLLEFERCKLEFVHAPDFVTDPSRTWQEVKQVCFRSFLNRRQLRKRFGKRLGDQIALDATTESRNRADDYDSRSRALDRIEPQATIWEIWDREEGVVRWVAVGYPGVLEEGKPYLRFKDFFPCPKPCYGTTTNDTLVPRADYVFYQDQAEEINRLTARIASLQDSLKIVGFYPAGPKGEGIPEIERAVSPEVENKMIAVVGWDNFLSKGIKGGAPIIFLPVAEVAEVLKGCVELRKQLIEDVNQIYGISDLMRGEGEPDETATAQRLKGNYGSLRIRERQQELARFCRDITRLVSEVVCNHFQPATIMSMSNMPLPTDQEVEQMQLEQQLAARAAALQQAQAAAAAQGGQPAGAPVSPAAPAPANQNHPVPGARQAPDGKYYVQHPQTGQYYRVDRKAA